MTKFAFGGPVLGFEVGTRARVRVGDEAEFWQQYQKGFGFMAMTRIGVT